MEDCFKDVVWTQLKCKLKPIKTSPLDRIIVWYLDILLEHCQDITEISIAMKTNKERGLAQEALFTAIFFSYVYVHTVWWLIGLLSQLLSTFTVLVSSKRIMSFAVFFSSLPFLCSIFHNPFPNLTQNRASASSTADLRYSGSTLLCRCLIFPVSPALAASSISCRRHKEWTLPHLEW